MRHSFTCRATIVALIASLLAACSQNNAFPVNPMMVPTQQSAALNHAAPRGKKCATLHVLKGKASSKSCITLSLVSFVPLKKVVGAYLPVNGFKRSPGDPAPVTSTRDLAKRPGQIYDPCSSSSSASGSIYAAGQPIAIAACASTSSSYTLEVTNCTWTGVPASAIGNYTWADTGSTTEPVEKQTAGNVLFLYATKPENGNLNAVCDVSDYSSSSSAAWPPFTFDIRAPSATVVTTYGSVVVDKAYPKRDYLTLHWGLPSQGAGSANWVYSVSNVKFPGQISMFQLVQSCHGRPWGTICTPTGQICADGKIPYAPKLTASTANTYKAFDSQDVSFRDNKVRVFGTYTVNDTYWDTFVYKPDVSIASAGPIWVKLAQLSYSWQAGVSYPSSGVWSWTQSPVVSKQQATYVNGNAGNWTCPWF